MKKGCPRAGSLQFSCSGTEKSVPLGLRRGNTVHLLQARAVLVAEGDTSGFVLRLRLTMSQRISVRSVKVSDDFPALAAKFAGRSRGRRGRRLRLGCRDRPKKGENGRSHDFIHGSSASLARGNGPDLMPGPLLGYYYSMVNNYVKYLPRQLLPR